MVSRKLYIFLETWHFGPAFFIRELISPYLSLLPAEKWGAVSKTVFLLTCSQVILLENYEKSETSRSPQNLTIWSMLFYSPVAITVSMATSSKKMRCRFQDSFFAESLASYTTWVLIWHGNFVIYPKPDTFEPIFSGIRFNSSIAKPRRKTRPRLNGSWFSYGDTEISCHL